MTRIDINSSSFRDPSGFVYTDVDSGILLRQVNKIYKYNYDLLISSGLYDSLVSSKRLVRHKEKDLEVAADKYNAYKVISPEKINFISYPFEWSFSQLKDAALLTLLIQKQALKHGMVIKDASAYNVQFLEGRPIWIDTLSFEKYIESSPWVAYRQFCQHYLAPLLVMKYTDIKFNQWFKINMDGVPLDLASSVLPFKTYFSFNILSHIHLHAKSQSHFADKAVDASRRKISKIMLLGFIDNLISFVGRLNWIPKGTEWGEYYSMTNYSNESFENKKKLVGKFLDQSGAKIVWDAGSNDGTFSRIASERGVFTVSFDFDPVSVEKNYRMQGQKKEKNILPLFVDITNPSPNFGWAGEERYSLEKRGPADCLLALALIHHIRISNNVPLIRIAAYFSRLARNIIIEFVPKNDSQVKKLFATRQDIFPDYNQASFEKEFKNYYTIINKEPIDGSERFLYLMRSKYDF
jgi:hypothetical protein